MFFVFSFHLFLLLLHSCLRLTWDEGRRCGVGLVLFVYSYWEVKAEVDFLPGLDGSRAHTMKKKTMMILLHDESSFLHRYSNNGVPTDDGDDEEEAKFPADAKGAAWGNMEGINVTTPHG